jgi:hypothetical protein
VQWTQNVSQFALQTCIGNSLRRGRQITRWDCQLHNVCLSVFRLSAWKNSAATWRIFMKFYIWVFIRKSLEKFQVSSKPDKKAGYCTWRLMYCMTVSRSVLLRMRNISNKRCRQNPNTHFVFLNFVFCLKSCRLWDKVEKYFKASPQMTIWRMRFACCIINTTNTHSEYVILFFFHGNNGYANAPQYYVLHIRTLPVLFTLINACTSRYQV